jgi:hypothetical protein
MEQNVNIKFLLMEKLMKYILSFFIVFVSALLFISCSDMRNDLPQAPEVTTHGSGVFNTTSSNFHGSKVVNSPGKFDDCKQCHAADLSGGITKVSCVKCHTSVDVHQEGIKDPNSDNFHGKFIANNLSGQMNNCGTCHGPSYQGGIVSPSCAICHSTIPVHVSGIVNPGSSNFHGKYIAANLNWDMRECGSCHATDFSGGLVAPSCLTCHTGTNGPEACNTCHGDFSDPSKIAPPRALNGSTDPSYHGVGAHASHLYNNNLGSNIRCSTCHTFPQSVYAPGHIDNSDGKAEINFGRLAVQGGANPTYDFTSNNCSNTYCHGNFVFYRDSSNQGKKYIYTSATITGNNYSTKWNKVDGSQMACGTCHGLPPTGHLNPNPPFQLTDCYYCHYNSNTMDITKHINGVADLW